MPQVNLGTDWADWLSMDYQAGDCLAFEPGLGVQWRGCCLLGEHQACAEAIPSTVLLAPCLRIFNLSGQQFSSDDVLEWNASHSGI
jgi:hypothetical protein